MNGYWSSLRFEYIIVLGIVSSEILQQIGVTMVIWFDHNWTILVDQLTIIWEDWPDPSSEGGE